jgi:hypothetical protein
LRGCVNNLFEAGAIFDLRREVYMRRRFFGKNREKLIDYTFAQQCL